MTHADIVIVGLLAGLVVFTFIYNSRKRKQNACGCTSSSCKAGNCKACIMSRSDSHEESSTDLPDKES